MAKYGKPHRQETHKALLEAAMCSMMYGFLPPLRLTCVRTLLHPSHVVPLPAESEVQLPGGCLEPDCRRGPTCRGNRLEWVEGSNQTRLMISCPHHKNEARWEHLPIEFELPPELTEELPPYIKHSHAELAAPGQRLLFVHARSGLGLDNVNLAQWWQDLLRRFEFENKFPPSKLRHIFVDERLGLDSVEGPNNKATARIMGNCVERWEISYNKQNMLRDVNQAARETASAWRQQLLALD